MAEIVKGQITRIKLIIPSGQLVSNIGKLPPGSKAIRLQFSSMDSGVLTYKGGDENTADADIVSCTDKENNPISLGAFLGSVTFWDERLAGIEKLQIITDTAQASGAVTVKVTAIT